MKSDDKDDHGPSGNKASAASATQHQAISTAFLSFLIVKSLSVLHIQTLIPFHNRLMNASDDQKF